MRRRQAHRSDAKVIDAAGALGRLGNNRELLYRLLDEFRNAEADTAQRLERLVAAGRIEEADRLVHSIKGTAMILGLERFIAVAAEIEKALRQGDRQAYAVLLAPFAHELDEAIGACAHVLAAQPATDTAKPAAAAPSREALQPLLDEFMILLDRNNMAALQIVPQLRDMLHGTSHGDAVAEIGACLHKLDFTGARNRTRQLAEHLSR